MGVTNLFSLVDKALITTYLSKTDIKDNTAVVDVSHWIYRSCYSCPEALYHRNDMTKVYTRIIKYIDQYVKVLEKHNVKMTFVFDGIKIPAKSETHRLRNEKKEEAKVLVEKFLKKGNKAEARKHMLRCVDVTFDMIEQVFLYCKKKDIDFIVAPYEADAQIAYLCREKICNFVVTEDTDLILYGCERIVYKLEPDTGRCQLYMKERLQKCFNEADHIDFEKFRRICILSGCDYLKNIQGVGLQSAKKFFMITRNDNIKQILPKLATYLKSNKLKGKVTDEYVRGFINAENTFKHHIVYDPKVKKLVPLEPYPNGCTYHDFPQAGKLFDRSIAEDFANGKINLDHINPDADLDSDDEAEILEPKPKKIRLAKASGDA